MLADHRADPGDDVPPSAPAASRTAHGPAGHRRRPSRRRRRPRDAGPRVRRRSDETADTAERRPRPIRPIPLVRSEPCAPRSCGPTSGPTSRPTTSGSSPSSTRSRSTRPRRTTSSGRRTRAPGAGGPRSVRRPIPPHGSGGWPSGPRCAAGAARSPGIAPGRRRGPSSTAASRAPAPCSSRWAGCPTPSGAPSCWSTWPACPSSRSRRWSRCRRGRSPRGCPVPAASSATRSPRSCPPCRPRHRPLRPAGTYW